MPTYTISPADYNALRAMITHEGAETLARDLKNGDLNSAYGQLIGLTETWLNRAAAGGKETNALQGLMAHPQVSFFPKDQAGIDARAAQLDPRITQMLNTYLHSRAAGDPGILGGVDHYLNPEVTREQYGLPDWYTKNAGYTIGKFGDFSSGGNASKQQDFLDIPGSYQVPQYDVKVSPQLQLNPTEGDVNALNDFRNSYQLPTPFPPARPDSGLSGIVPRGPGEGNYEPGVLDQFSDGITRGLETAGRGAADLFTSGADAVGRGLGSFFNGSAATGPAPGDYDFAGGRNFAGNAGYGLFGSGLNGSGISPNAPPDYGFAGSFAPGMAGQLPAGFDSAAYLRANPDVAAAGIDAATHWRNFGMQEGRSLGAPGLTQTLGPPGSTPSLGAFDPAATIGSPFLAPTVGSGTAASTIGPNGTLSALPADFNAAAYVQANPDLARAGVDPVAHYLTSGFREIRPLTPGGTLQALGPDGITRTYSGDGTITGTLGAPGLSSTFGPTTMPTIGPDGGITISSTGLTPTIGPGGTVPSFSPGQGTSSFLAMPSTTATTIGAPDARGALPPGFDPISYVNANADLAALGFTGQQAVDHFLNFGQHEARALAPGMEARVYAPPGVTPTIGPGSLTPTFGAPDLTQTLAPPALTTTLGPPAATPTLGPTTTTPSWSPFGGAGIASPFGFSGFNPSQGLGAGAQSFGSLWPVGDSAPAAQPPAGPDMSNPFGFTSMDVSGFDPSAAGGGGGGSTSGPNSVNDMGISGGFDSEGAMRRVLEQQAADIRRADQAAKTPMHSDPNAFNVAIANGGNTVGMGTALQTPGAIGGPVVPNVTVRNYATSAPGAMFAMFAPWR